MALESRKGRVQGKVAVVTGANGGLGSAIAECKASLKESPRQLFLGIKDTYSKGGNYKFLQEKHRLIPEKIVEDILFNLSS